MHCLRCQQIERMIVGDCCTRGGPVMDCRRCQGLMVEEQFFDVEETQGFMWMKGWRCGDCGHAENALTQLTLPHT